MRWFRRKGIRGAVTMRDRYGVTRLYVFTGKSVFEYDPDYKAWRVISETVAKELLK